MGVDDGEDAYEVLRGLEVPTRDPVRRERPTDHDAHKKCKDGYWAHRLALDPAPDATTRRHASPASADNDRPDDELALNSPTHFERHAPRSISATAERRACPAAVSRFDCAYGRCAFA